jgi:hypothetical protein
VRRPKNSIMLNTGITMLTIDQAASSHTAAATCLITLTFACISPTAQLNLLSSLDHPNIVRYIGTEKEGGSLFIFLEYVPVGAPQQQQWQQWQLRLQQVEPRWLHLTQPHMLVPSNWSGEMPGQLRGGRPSTQNPTPGGTVNMSCDCCLSPERRGLWQLCTFSTVGKHRCTKCKRPSSSTAFWPPSPFGSRRSLTQCLPAAETPAGWFHCLPGGTLWPPGGGGHQGVHTPAAGR